MRPNQSHRQLHSKGNHKNKWKDNLQNGRKYLQIIDVTDKGLISNICKQLIKLNNNKKAQSKNGQKITPKETIRWPVDT